VGACDIAAFSRGEILAWSCSAIAAAISPYRAIRDEVRAKIERFVEVYAKCPVDVLSERDVKGLYKKAMAGEIKNFTGVDDPYEEPLNAEVTIYSDRETVDYSVAKVLQKLEALGYIPAALENETDRAQVEGRLRALGYIE